MDAITVRSDVEHKKINSSGFHFVPPTICMRGEEKEEWYLYISDFQCM